MVRAQLLDVVALEDEHPGPGTAVAFHRTADVLEQSARLADADAERRARRGETGLHTTERERAAFARDAARRARTNAQRLGRPSPPEHV